MEHHCHRNTVHCHRNTVPPASAAATHSTHARQRQRKPSRQCAALCHKISTLNRAWQHEAAAACPRHPLGPHENRKETKGRGRGAPRAGLQEAALLALRAKSTLGSRRPRRSKRPCARGRRTHNAQYTDTTHAPDMSTNAARRRREKRREEGPRGGSGRQRARTGGKRRER
jgi:hypothetical protein